MTSIVTSARARGGVRSAHNQHKSAVGALPARARRGVDHAHTRHRAAGDLLQPAPPGTPSRCSRTANSSSQLCAALWGKGSRQPLGYQNSASLAQAPPRRFGVIVVPDVVERAPGNEPALEALQLLAHSKRRCRFSASRRAELFERGPEAVKQPGILLQLLQRLNLAGREPLSGRVDFDPALESFR